MSEVIAATEWHTYSEQKPPKEGAYRWRVPSVAVPGLFVVFVAHMRERGAGYVRAVSPVFDYWDGYRLHVPAGTQWQEVDETVACKSYEATEVSVDAPASYACPYCGKQPTIKGFQRGSSGGVVIGNHPHEFNAWHLECCQWARTPSFKDPRELIAKRNAVLAPFYPRSIPGSE